MTVHADFYPFTAPAELPEDDPQGECPDCRVGNMSFQVSSHVEPHGEHVTEAWFECGNCGYQESIKL